MEIIHKTPEGEVKREAAPTGFQKVVILGQDGNQKEVPVRVDEEGRLVLVADIELGEVDVNIGEVEQGAVGPNAESWMMKLTDANGDPISSTNPLPTQLTGSFDALTTSPVTGAKTVSTTAAEIFAGASRLAGRYMLAIYNDSDNTVYWGPAGVTTATGFPLFPGDTQIIRLSPDTETEVFCVAAASSAVRVVELA